MLEREVVELKKRLSVIEQWQIEQRVTTSARNERDKHLDERFDRLEKGTDEIKGYLLKIVWVIILAIIGGFVTFMMNGGISSAL